MPLTIALGTAAAALVLTDLSFWEAAIVGTVLAPTDAALGQAVVSNPRVPDRVRQALNVEAGLNEGLSVPFLALFLTLAVTEEELQPASYWIRFALEQVGLGVGVGVGAARGWLVSRASKRGWMTYSSQRLALLALALIAWALADQIGGNGFIAAFVGGLVGEPTVERVGEVATVHRSRRTAAQPERVLYLWCARSQTDPALGLGGGSLWPAQPLLDPRAPRRSLSGWHRTGRRLGGAYGLVRPAGGPNLSPTVVFLFFISTLIPLVVEVVDPACYASIPS
jgi:hypothetical protein